MRREANAQMRHQWPRPSRRRLLATAVGSAAAAGVSLIGCKGQEKPVSVPGVAQPGGQPKHGGIAGHYTNIGETPHLDPHQQATLTLHEGGVGLAYSRLFRWKLEEGVYPQSLLAEGDLVERWEQPDAQTYVAHLYRGVKWHNLAPVNGRELVSQDVIFSFNRQVAERVNAEMLAGLEKMTPVDNYTLRFELAKPDTDFLFMLADTRCKIVAPEAVELRGDLKQGPVIGTGPWLFQEWQPNQVVRVSRNPEYFRPGLPYLDGLHSFRIADPQTAQAAFRTKQIHVYDFANRQIYEVLRRDVPDAQLQDAKLIGALAGTKVWLHTERPPTSDIRVRQAISKMLDRNAYVQSVLFGSGWINAGIFVPFLDWHLPETELQRLLAQDLAEARRLLSAAGVTNWAPHIKNFSPPESRQAGDLFVAQLRALQISPTVEVVDNVRMLGEVWTRGEFEIAVSQQQPQSGTNVLLRRFYQTGGSQNGGKLSDRQLDDLIERQAGMVNDPQERKRLLQDIQRRVIELAAVINIYSRNEEVVVWPILKGYLNSRGGEYSRWERAWLDV